MGEVTREQIEKDIYKIIAKLAGVGVDDLNPEDSFVEDLGFDSLKSMEAISRITEIYDIDPDLDELEDLQQIQDLVEYVVKKVG